MELYERLSKYKEACIQKGALTFEQRKYFDCMWKPEPSKAGFQLGHNKVSDVLGFRNLTQDSIRSLRICIDALAERDTAPCRGRIPVGEDNLEVALASYRGERELFETIFPRSEFAKVYAPT